MRFGYPSLFSMLSRLYAASKHCVATKIKQSNQTVLSISFNSDLAVPLTILGQCHGDSLTNLMLITAIFLFLFWPRSYQQLQNTLGFFGFFNLSVQLQCLNPLGYYFPNQLSRLFHSSSRFKKIPNQIN